MPELIALRAVFGQDEVNHGTTRYRVGSDGLVRVPREAASYLISKGGFAMARTTAIPLKRVQPSNTESGPLVRLHHEAAGGCSYGGCEYPVGENGDVLVPAEAAADLIAHGFVPVSEAGLAGGPEASAAGPMAAAKTSEPARSPRR